MEWVQTTGKTLAEAEDRALESLGVGRDEAEFEVLEEPRSGLFGLLRGEARVRARVRPAQVRPKQDRRGRKRKRSDSEPENGSKRSGGRNSNRQGGGKSTSANGNSGSSESDKKDGPSKRRESNKKAPMNDERAQQRTDGEEEESPVEPSEVAQAASTFLSGLTQAFGLESSVDTAVEGTEIDAVVEGEGLGLMIGPSGRTLNAIQDLARVSAQRRLGDHVTRLRVDIGGYREKRRMALEVFTRKVAEDVIETGQAKALEPMASADRKVVHDTVNEIDGVESRSDGDDPGRRVIIVPAE